MNETSRRNSRSRAYGSPVSHEKNRGTGFPACAWTLEGGCPTLTAGISRLRVPPLFLFPHRLGILPEFSQLFRGDVQKVLRDERPV